jgi:ribosomal protein S18 acetylase RimI-like enzyme
MPSPLQIRKHSSPAPDDVVREVLRINAQNLVAKPEEARARGGGFLLVKLDEAIIRSGVVYAAERDGATAGYLLLTTIDAFFAYFQSDAAFTPTGGNEGVLQKMKTDVYIYQIAVAPNATKQGIGAALLGKVSEDFAARAVTADVLIQPVDNPASMALFRKAGFAEIGTLACPGFSDFGDIETTVFRKEP